MGITGIFNLEIGERPRSDVRRLYEETLKLTGLPDACSRGYFRVGIGDEASPFAANITFAGSGTSIRAATLAVARGELPKWRSRLQKRGARLIGRAWQFDEEHLCFVDDADFDLSIMEVDFGKTFEVERAGPTILGLRGVEVEADPGGELEALLAAAGLSANGQEGPIVRYEPREGLFALDVFRSAASSFKHQLVYEKPQRLSFAVSDLDDLQHLEQQLRAAGFEPIPFCERKSAFVVRIRSQRNFEIGFLSSEIAPRRPDLA